MLKHKIGDTLTLAGTVTLTDVSDFTGWTIASQFRQSGSDALLPGVAAAWVSQDTSTGTYTISATAANTATWVPCDAVCDVQFTDPSGGVTSTDTFTIEIVRDVTR